MVIEDDSVTRARLNRHLSFAGYHALSANSAEHAVALMRQHGVPHLAIVDVNLPGMSGAELSRRIRESIDLPIIVVSAEKDEDFIVTALREYADDYVAKPFDPRDLLARVDRLMRRLPSFDYVEDIPLNVDDALQVNLHRQKVKIDGREISLTPIENKLLSTLMANPNQALPMNTLLKTVWPNEEVTEDALRVQIHRLRNKINSKRNKRTYIQTERGIGYRFAVPNMDQMVFSVQF
ncbi:MAG: response regulator transcription factor [Caldilineaceae bacterium]|nr:response regulator transcription factor [Caldilineaceae bacterium]